MKNDDITHIKMIIEYCDIVETLLNEYERNYTVFKSSL